MGAIRGLQWKGYLIHIRPCQFLDPNPIKNLIKFGEVQVQ